MSIVVNLPSGARVLHRVHGLGTVESSPKPGAVLVAFDSAETVLVRARDVWTKDDHVSVATLANVGYKLGVQFPDLARGLEGR